MSTSALAYTEESGSEVVASLLRIGATKLGANATMCAFSREGSSCAISLGDGRVSVIGGFSPEASIDDVLGAARADVRAHKVAAVAVRSIGEGFVSAGQDGRVMRISAGGDDASLLWDAEGDWIEALAVSEPGAQLAAAAGRRVVVCSLEGGRICDVTLKHTISSVAFDGPGRRLAVSHYGGVTLLDAVTGEIDDTLVWKGSHIGVSWSPDGRYVVTSTQERELHVWDLVTMQDFRIGGYPRKIHRMTWTPDGKTMACSGADVITAWSFAGAGPNGRPPVEIGYVFGGYVTEVAARPAASIVAGGFSTGNVLIGATIKGEALLARVRTGRPVTSLAWSPDGLWLAAADVAGELAMIRVPSDLGVR